MKTGKRKDYAQISAEARSVFNEYKKTLPSQNKTAFPTDIDLRRAKQVSEWENLCLRIERDCKDKLDLMVDLEKIKELK